MALLANVSKLVSRKTCCEVRQRRIRPIRHMRSVFFIPPLLATMKNKHTEFLLLDANLLGDDAHVRAAVTAEALQDVGDAMLGSDVQRPALKVLRRETEQARGGVADKFLDATCRGLQRALGIEKGMTGQLGTPGRLIIGRCVSLPFRDDRVGRLCDEGHKFSQLLYIRSVRHVEMSELMWMGSESYRVVNRAMDGKNPCPRPSALV